VRKRCSLDEGLTDSFHLPETSAAGRFALPLRLPVEFTSPPGCMSGLVYKYRFGPYEVRVRTRELFKHGTRLKLRPQPFQVLQVLVERAGDVVTREELQQMLWPAETFVDFEHGLNTSVKELRRVLSDSAAEPRYIETLPKLGYRIVAAVEAGALKLLYLALRNIIQKWDTVQGWKHPRQGAAQVPAIGLRRYRDAVGGIPPRERVRDHPGEWERKPAVRFDQVMRFSGALRRGSSRIVSR